MMIVHNNWQLSFIVFPYIVNKVLQKLLQATKWQYGGQEGVLCSVGAGVGVLVAEEERWQNVLRHL